MSGRGFSTQSFTSSIGYGLLPGYRRIVGLGNNPDVDQASVPEHIWPIGGLYPWPAAAVSLEAVSSSAQDGPAGTGISTISVALLDSAYVEATATVTLNGTTPVAIPGEWLRINSALTTGKGSGAPAFRALNVGDIHIRVAGGGQVLCVIQAGRGISRQALYTVPAGHTLEVTDNYIAFNRGTGGGTTRYMTAATSSQSPNGILRLPFDVSCDGEPFQLIGNPGIMIPEKSDYAIEIISVSSDNSDITGAFLGILKQNQLP